MPQNRRGQHRGLAELLESADDFQIIRFRVRDLEIKCLELPDEPARPFLLRMLKDLLRRSFLIDSAVVHIEDAVRDVARKLHLVRDDHHGHAVLRKGANDGKHLTDHGRVERGSRLIEEQDLRFHGNGAGDRHTLFLPAGQLIRIVLRLVPKSDARKEREPFLIRLLLRDL